METGNRPEVKITIRPNHPGHHKFGRLHPLVLAITLALNTSAALGATIVVNSHSLPGCTLTDAITSANSDTSTGGCTAGSGVDHIVFDSTISGTTITPESQLEISSDMTIDGGSAVTVSGSSTHRVIQVSSYDTEVTLQGLTISDGYAGPYTSGGGIRNLYGNLTIQDCTISNNVATYSGGGVSSSHGGSFTIENSLITGNHSGRWGGGVGVGSFNAVISDSVISGNTADDGGGGVINGGGASIIANTTISGNSARDGGGIYNVGTLGVLNSTVSGNSATDKGGGIVTEYFGDLTLVNSTVSGNSAVSPGGLYDHYGILEIFNTVIANNTGGDCGNFLFRLDTNVNNWFGDDSCDGIADGDPQLGILADNGGPTLTHHPLSQSGLIDAGDSLACTPTDQRGIRRPKDGDESDTAECDIGSVEVYSYICQSGPISIGGPTTLIGTPTYQSETTISTTGDVIVNNDADVTFEATYGISIGAGFQVVVGGVFSANIVEVNCE